MTDLTTAPYGTWKSPITSDLVASEKVRLMDIILEGSDTYWIESRPQDQGRCVIVWRQASGKMTDVNPAPLNARSRVHEYGGAPMLLAGGVLYYSNLADNRIYRQEPGRAPQPFTVDAPSRYADMIWDSRRKRIICVQEDHSQDGARVTNAIASIDLAGKGKSRLLVSGNDFYAAPRLSPNGSQMAWLTWNHPNMPWDGTELWVAAVAPNGSLKGAELVAGGRSESIFQPQWSPDGTLYFASDRTGWWNLYRWMPGRVEPLVEMEAEFGLPQWVFGGSTFAFESAAQIVCAFRQGGVSYLARLRTETGHLEPIETPFTSIDSLCAAPGRVVFRAASATEPWSIVQLDLDTMEFQVLHRSTGLAIDPHYISPPQLIEFATENGLTAYAFFYPPRNREFQAPDDELPPLLVESHGGPTSATENALDLSKQFWTSRGFAVLDVNYRGSTGYGRAYREQLYGNWGVVDVDDCSNGARFLINQGLVDGDRVAIHGGSAGGYTTLCALTFRDFFKAGASYYGVGDLTILVRDTHKFESRYLDQLIGPYPEKADLYHNRSPINFPDRLSCPVIFFQGLEDKVVPPNQAEAMVKALRAKGTPVAYLAFDGEQHGFRQASNIKRALDAELYFYSRVFGFEPADQMDPVKIENLDQ